MLEVLTFPPDPSLPSTVKLVVLSNKYSVTEWLMPAYVKLIWRTHSLSAKECQMIPLVQYCYHSPFVISLLPQRQLEGQASRL